MPYFNTAPYKNNGLDTAAADFRDSEKNNIPGSHPDWGQICRAYPAKRRRRNPPSPPLTKGGGGISISLLPYVSTQRRSTKPGTAISAHRAKNRNQPKDSAMMPVGAEASTRGTPIRLDSRAYWVAVNFLLVMLAM